MAYNPFIFANRNGIPRLEATSVNVGTDAVTYQFRNHQYIGANFAGLILFKLPSFTAPATAVPIRFDTNGTTIDLTTIGGTAVTSADLNLAGIYLAFYDYASRTLQILTGI